jgi:hypothetical protein
LLLLQISDVRAALAILKEEVFAESSDPLPLYRSVMAGLATVAENMLGSTERQYREFDLAKEEFQQA